MTNREFLTAVANANISEEITAKANEELGKMDATNAKRKTVQSKTAKENEPIKKAIMEFLASVEGATAPVIGEKVGITTQKASALARQLADAGAVVAYDVKVPKKGTLKAYKVATEEVATEEVAE